VARVTTGGVIALLQLNTVQTLTPSVASRSVDPDITVARTRRCRSMGDRSRPEIRWTVVDVPREVPQNPPELKPPVHPQEIDPLYLFACHMEWERSEEPGAGWELLAAAKNSHIETRSHARALLSSSRHLGGVGLSETPSARKRQSRVEEDDMKAPYGLDIIENCCECPAPGSRRFCDLSQTALGSLSEASQKSVLPAGAILFVEGQDPRGVFIVCSGKVNLSTTSREGKILILKTAGPGEALGLSAAVSGVTYETTAETATPCHLNFLDRKHFLELTQNHCEIGLHTARCLSRDYQSAYRDIHHLVLTRSSSGKLARLLLSQAVPEGEDSDAGCRPTPMTHEEMAMRIGASRETVTRLLSTLRRKRLIRLDGPMLVIRDRTALEALTV
jgi:CRP/FNR family transcriptional regulator, cyclic AMP receptor protein